MFKFVALATAALLAVTSNAGSVCADAQQPAELPPPPYCPTFTVSADQQRLIFDRFVDGFIMSGKPAQALIDHISDDYIQHNPNFLSGKAVVVGAFSGNVSAFGISYPGIIITQAFDPNTQIGMVHHYSKPAPGTQPNIVVDIFRMDGSCIVEHWDVIQRRPENATNPLAMF